MVRIVTAQLGMFKLQCRVKKGAKGSSLFSQKGRSTSGEWCLSATHKQILYAVGHTNIIRMF